MSSSCFSPTGLLPGVPLPSTGSFRLPFPRFHGNISTLRLPAARLAALRCLRLAIPREHSVISLPTPPSVATTGLELVTRYLQPGLLPWRRQDLLRSWGTLMCLCPALRPRRDRRARPLRHANTAPAATTAKARHIKSLSGLHHTASALAVYASQCRSPDPTQDSLPAVGQTLPDGIDYPKGSNERFQTHLMCVILLSQASVAQGGPDGFAERTLQS